VFTIYPNDGSTLVSINPNEGAFISVVYVHQLLMTPS